MLTDEQKRRIEKTDREYDFGKKMSSSVSDTDLPDEAYDLSKFVLPEGFVRDKDGNISREQ